MSESPSTRVTRSLTSGYLSHEDWKRRRIDRWVSVGLALWVAVFFDFGGLLRFDTPPVTGTTYVDFVSESIRSGSLKNQVLAVTFAAIGAYYFPAGWRWLRRGRSLPLVLLLAYVTWSVLSLTWSVNAELTERRVIEMALIAIGCVGLGAGFYGARPDGRRRLLRDALVVGALAWMIWLPAILSGDLSVLSPDWSLVPVGVGDRYGIPIAFGLVLALVARSSASVNGYLSRRFLTAYSVVATVTLVALRKRTLVAATIVVVVVAVLALSGRARRRRLAAGAILTAAFMLVAAYVLGLDPGGSILPIATRGEEVESLTSLSGRVPLWQELIGSYVGQRPFAGYGFGAFWRPEVIDLMWEDVGWPATSAHNGILEEVLATGLIGGILLYASWLGLVRKSLRSAWGDGHDDFGVLVAAWALLLLLVSLAVATLQLWGEVSLMMPLIAFAAAEVWAVREKHDLVSGNSGRLPL